LQVRWLNSPQETWQAKAHSPTLPHSRGHILCPWSPNPHDIGLPRARCNTQTFAQVQHFPRRNDAPVDWESNGQLGVSLWVKLLTAVGAVPCCPKVLTLTAQPAIDRTQTGHQTFRFKL
jgi:hypothetical protein